jgi:hypothetical protein
MKSVEVEQLLMMLGQIREDQHLLLMQQQKILTGLADVKSFQKRLQQEMDGEGTPMDLLTVRNGFIN